MGYRQTIMIGNHKKALKIIDQKNYTIEKRENNKYIVNKENKIFWKRENVEMSVEFFVRIVGFVGIILNVHVMSL